MITRFAICFTVLALGPLCHAVEDGDQTLITKTPPVIVPTQARAARIETDGTLHLSAGSLPEVIAQLEQVIPAISPDGTMPNVIFDEPSRSLRVPADLRLRKVTPIQAVALIAAAAGCALEPVLAPREAPLTAELSPADPSGAPRATPQSASSAIVGYRIVSGAPQRKSDDLSGIGISLANNDGVITVGEIYPNTPAARSGKLKSGDRLISVAERGNPPVLLAGVPPEEVAKLIRGAAGSVVELQVQRDQVDAPISIPIVREKMPLPGPAWPSNPTVQVVTPAGGDTLAAPSTSGGLITALASPRATAQILPQWSPANPYGTFAAAADPSAPAVRVYALGSLFSGTEAEAMQKEEAFRELVASALKEVQPNRKLNPTLSFHTRSKALIVKGTPGDHALIQEIVAAMKENQSAETSSPKSSR